MNKEGAVLAARILTELRRSQNSSLELSRGGKLQRKKRTTSTWIVLL